MKNKRFILLIGCIMFLMSTLMACSFLTKEDNKNNQENEAVSEEDSELFNSELATELKDVTDVIGTEVTDSSSSTIGNHIKDEDVVVDASGKYERCYDKNRDGLVSEAEIKAYDKYFYAASPTSKEEKKCY